MSPDGSPAIVVLVTVATQDEAEKIATDLVAERLAACVNIVGPIRSIYRWEGKLQRDSELLLIIKTRNQLFARLEKRIREIHSYETPEVVALPVGNVSLPYLRWLESTLTSKATPER